MNRTVIGIDVGGTTTKIVGFRQNENGERELIAPQFVRATDPLTSIYGAFGKFTAENNLTLADIDRIMMTGAGSVYVKNSIYNLPCTAVPEFTSSGVGGGTLMGLSRKLIGVDTIEHIEQLATEGNLDNIDLRIKDIAQNHSYHGINENLTAANFGKVSDMATSADLALGISNLVAETIAMMSIFAARSYNIKDIVLIGNLTTIEPIRNVFESLGDSFGVRFVIPENAQFGTVIGAALHKD